MEKIDLLRDIPIFHELTDAELALISNVAFFKKYEPDTVIFQENMPGEALYIVKMGSVKISKMLVEGQQRTLAILGNGDFFGEMALLDGSPRSATATVMERSVLIVITKEDFLQMLEEHGKVAVKFFKSIIKVFSLRLRDSNESFRTLLKKTTRNH